MFIELDTTDSKEDIDRLTDLTEDTAFVCQIISIASYVVVTLTAYTLFINILIRNTFRELSVKVKISLLTYLIYAPAMTALMTVILFKDSGWGIIIYFGSKWRGLTAVGYTIWMSLHW